MSNIINEKARIYAGEEFSITSTEGKKYLLRIEESWDAEDPRTWDNLGTMLCCNRRYRLGDCNSNEETEEALIELCRKYGKTDEEIDEMTFSDEVRFLLNQENICSLPLWIYDHSGISMSTGAVDQWDSSFVGLIYVEKENFIECVGYEPDDWKAEATKILREEISTYDDYLQGNIYAYYIYEPTVVITQTMDGDEISREINEKGVEVDSCCGIYGLNLEYIKENSTINIAEIEQVR